MRHFLWIFLFVSCATQQQIPTSTPCPACPPPIIVKIHDTIPKIIYIKDSTSSLGLNLSFGTYADGSHDDYPVIQANIDRGLLAGIIQYYLPNPHLISKGLLFKDPAGIQLISVELNGEGTGYAKTWITCSDKLGFAIDFEIVKGARINGITVVGPNTIMNTYSQFDILKNPNSTFITPGCSNLPTAPNAGFAIDFYGNGSKSGSTDVIFKNCTARNFVVGYAISTNGVSQNGEAIGIIDSWGDHCKAVVATGQSQTRTVFLDNLKSWGGSEYIIDCRSYGNGTGCPPSVDRINVAGGNRHFCNLNNWISLGLPVFRSHIESLYDLGGNKTNYVGTLSFDNSWINLAGLVSDNGTLITAPDTVFQGGELRVTGKSYLFQYGSLKSAPLTFNCATTYFEGTTFDSIPKNLYVGSVNSFTNCRGENGPFGDNLQVGGAGAIQLHTTLFCWYGNMSCFYPNTNPLVRSRLMGAQSHETFIPTLIIGDVAQGSATISNVVVEGGTTFPLDVQVYINSFPPGTRIVSYSAGNIQMSLPAIYSENNAAIISGNWHGEEVGVPNLQSPFMIGYKVCDVIINNRRDLYPNVNYWVCTKSGITSSTRLPTFQTY